VQIQTPILYSNQLVGWCIPEMRGCVDMPEICNSQVFWTAEEYYQ
jgi:hypothetical protein